MHIQGLARVVVQLWKYKSGIKCVWVVRGKKQLSFHCGSNYRETGINAHNSVTFNAPLGSERSLEQQQMRLIDFRVDFIPILFVWLITHSKLIQEHPLSTGRMLWAKDNEITDRIQMCAEKFQGEHFSFQINSCKVKQSIKNFLQYMKLLIWLIFLSLKWMYFSTKLISYLGSFLPLVINMKVSKGTFPVS